MTHGDAIIYCYGVKFSSNATCLGYFSSNKVTHIFEVHVSGNELRIGISNSNHWLVKVVILHASRPPERTSTSHVSTLSCGMGAILGHLFVSCC